MRKFSFAETTLRNYSCSSRFVYVRVESHDDFLNIKSRFIAFHHDFYNVTLCSDS